MADFDLTQTDAQVQSILNDAQNAQGAGAQTTLTTDYIMLKDTSGNYHKILKDSFTEACRNVLAGLLVNNDKGTTISQIPAIASGDFGSVTPANLASVLGAFITKVTVSNFGDLTDLNFEAGTGPGLYWSMCAPSSAPANLPSAISTSTRFLLVYLYTAYDRYQIVIDRSSNTPYGRYGVGNSGSVSWSLWKEL